MSSSIQDNMPTLNNMFDFYQQTSQNVQLVTVNFDDHHSSLELLLLLTVLVACLMLSPKSDFGLKAG